MRFHRAGARPCLAVQVTLVAICGAVLAATPMVPASAHRRHHHHRHAHTALMTTAIRHGSGVMRVHSMTGKHVIGVASFNIKGTNRLRKREHDIRAITHRRDVDIIGFQETRDNHGHRGLARALPHGWAFYQDRKHGNASEDAVAWRSGEFTKVSTATYRGSRSMKRILRTHRDAGHTFRTPSRRFPSRYTVVVTLRENVTGKTIDLINLHDNQFIEKFKRGRPGHPYDNANAAGARRHIRQVRHLVAASTADYTFVTGDFNWDYIADRRVRARGFILREVGPVAVSSYLSLGIRHLAPTMRMKPYRRYSDYVMIKRGDRAGFVRQQVARHYHSDHRPLIARIALW